MDGQATGDRQRRDAGHQVFDRRNDFGAVRRRTFLDTLAATVGRATVYRVRRTDGDFAADWQEALAIGHDLIEAKLMRCVMSAGGEAAHGGASGQASDAGGRASGGAWRDGEAGQGRSEAGSAQGAIIAADGTADAARDRFRAGSGLLAGNVTAWIQVALHLLNRHRAGAEGRRGAMRGDRMPTLAETDALLARRLDMVSRSRPNLARDAG